MTDPASTPPARDPVGWLNNQPYLLLSLTSLFWAGNIVLARFVAGHVPPMTLSCVRWIGAFVAALRYDLSLDAFLPLLPLLHRAAPPQSLAPLPATAS